MKSPGFDRFFAAAMGSNRTPYDYQRRLAGGDEGTECISQLIDIPTGLGKTAAVVLAWLWNRVNLSRNDWPRRLVYCLPMRTLVEQTKANTEGWVRNLGSEGLIKSAPGIQILRGGEEPGEWDIYPERDAVLIGTQDMLLSRALNRGYGMSRYRWPMHFGLLNNDCLWVLDEMQLMGVAIETSSQLNGFRSSLKTFGTARTWWMSATVDEDRLNTVDNLAPESGWLRTELTKDEKSTGRAGNLFNAKKTVAPVALKLSGRTKGKYPSELADLAAKTHRQGTLTLVVVNRVSRAQDIYEALVGGKKPLIEYGSAALVHSRFRPKDRAQHEKLLFEKGQGIVVATQAVEAGVDVSAKLLITELAPWSSIVQRMGRCNRRAEDTGDILWIDIEPDPKGDLVLPYTESELAKARDAVSTIQDASPNALRKISVLKERVIRPVIRKRDLVDLFDTTPDLCGQDLDISRYVRDGEDNDVQFFWREIGENLSEQAEPTREELCRVSIGEAAKFLKRESTRAWRWNALEEQWEVCDFARPGAVYMVEAKSGGYSDDLGWTGEPKDKPSVIETKGEPPNSYRKDPLSFKRNWQTLAEHTGQVLEKTDALAKEVDCDTTISAALHTAALWHDIGKAHAEFQKALMDGPKQPPDPNAVYAKSENPPSRKAHRHYRSVRHELASALAWLLRGPADAPERDLIGYLIAAHHGKVRLSIRSLPDEESPFDPEQLFARGVWDGDELPDALGLMDGSTKLDLSFMRMGEGPHGPSWLARAIKVRDQFGPFRLAYLETLLRAADWNASKAAGNQG